MTVAWKHDPSPTPVAAERLAALLSLPLSDEPLTEEEREAFEQAERFLADAARRSRMSWTLEWGPVVYRDVLHIPWRTAGMRCAAVIHFAETNRGPVQRVSPHDPGD